MCQLHIKNEGLLTDKYIFNVERSGDISFKLSTGSSLFGQCSIFYNFIWQVYNRYKLYNLMCIIYLVHQNLHKTIRLLIPHISQKVHIQMH